MGAFLKMINFILRMRNLKSIGGLDVQILTDLSLVCAKEIQTKSRSFGQFWGHFWEILRSQQLQVISWTSKKCFVKNCYVTSPEESTRVIWCIIWSNQPHTCHPGLRGQIQNGLYFLLEHLVKRSDSKETRSKVSSC